MSPSGGHLLRAQIAERQYEVQRSNARRRLLGPAHGSDGALQRSQMGDKTMQRFFGLLVGMIVAGGLLTACTVTPIQPPTPAAEPAPAGESAGATVIGQNMAGLLARQLQVAPADVEVVAAEPTEWPDACLGAGAPAEACAQVTTPGYVVTLRVAGQDYTYHTDPQGYQSRLVGAPEPALSAPIIAWTGPVDNGSCQEALISADGVAFGPCGSGVKLGGKFVSAARLDALRTWAEQFAAFEATTDLGTVSFAGAGPAVATPAEQRQLAQWAQTATMEAAGGASLAGLRWQGPAAPGSPDTSQCAVLQIGDGAAGLGACDGTMSTQPLDGRMADQWAEIEARFAPFVYETPTETLFFSGMGTIAGEAWQRALVAWARMRHAELSSGRVSAAAATVMSWHLGPLPGQPEICRHLTVLDYGYAQAETRPCAGGEVLASSNGWLETAELEQLDRWVYERAALPMDDNYIATVGSQPMSEEEITAAGQWAAEVWNRLAGGGTAVSPASEPTSMPAPPPAACPTPAADAQLWVDEEHGYCLLYPAGYVAERTSPNEVNLVLGSIMNHTDPRVSIAVEDAAGRTLVDVTKQLLADYVPAGFAVEPGYITVDGVEAVMLDNLPGQDLNRRVAFIQNGRLYSLFFTPLGGATPLEPFYQGILDSFRFLEETVATPTPDPATMAVLPSDVPYIMALVNVNIRSGPGTKIVTAMNGPRILQQTD